MRRTARARANKISREAAGQQSAAALKALDNISDKERQEILKYVETEETEGETIDENSIKRMVLVFEKRALKNREMRIKFPDNPEKFMESEVRLTFSNEIYVFNANFFRSNWIKRSKKCISLPPFPIYIHF